jgi:hypothetical protein
LTRRWPRTPVFNVMPRWLLTLLTKMMTASEGHARSCAGWKPRRAACWSQKHLQTGPVSRLVRAMREMRECRRSFAPHKATKDADLQGVYNGSDGTRTRDLRRDSSALWFAARSRGSPLVARCAAFPVLALPAFTTGCRRCVPRTFQNGCALARGLRPRFRREDGTRPATSGVTGCFEGHDGTTNCAESV